MKTSFVEPTKRRLNPKDDPCISKIERVKAFSVGLSTTKSHHLKIFKFQYLGEFLRYGPDFLHVIINFIGFKITFSNMGSYGAPSLISFALLFLFQVNFQRRYILLLDKFCLNYSVFLWLIFKAFPVFPLLSTYSEPKC